MFHYCDCMEYMCYVYKTDLEAKQKICLVQTSRMVYV